MTRINIQFSLFSAFYSPLISTISGGFLAAEGLDFRTEDAGSVRLYFDISRAIIPVVKAQMETGFKLR